MQINAGFNIMSLQKQKVQQAEALIHSVDRLVFIPGSGVRVTGLNLHAQAFIITWASKMIDYTKSKGKQVDVVEAALNARVITRITVVLSQS